MGRAFLHTASIHIVLLATVLGGYFGAGLANDELAIRQIRLLDDLTWQRHSVTIAAYLLSLILSTAICLAFARSLRSFNGQRSLASALLLALATIAHLALLAAVLIAVVVVYPRLPYPGSWVAVWSIAVAATFAIAYWVTLIR